MSEQTDPLDDFHKLRVSSPIASPTLPAASLLKGDVQARLLAFQKGRTGSSKSNDVSSADEIKNNSSSPLPQLSQSYLMPSAKLDDSQVDSKTTPLPSQLPLSPSSQTNSTISGLNVRPITGGNTVSNMEAASNNPLKNSTTNLDNDPKPMKLNLGGGVTPSSPQGSPQVRGKFELHKTPSLSQRRGMKLDVSGLQKNTSTSSSSSSTPQSATSTNSTSSTNKVGQGLFNNYSKYVDIKEGKLNFAGKASVHSQGVDFSSGSSFRISRDQLEFVEELGRGNYGTVSKVIHKPTGVLMAMKEVRLELEESKFTQILMELEVLHRCNSPFIVDFYGAFFVEGGVYMCMEYMDGGSLDKIFGGEGVQSEAALAYITESVIRGLKALKDEHNIIHRDVKPTNILVNTAGRVKLCDFGVSGNLVASMARTNIGCQSYMAPERIWSKSPLDSNTYTVQSDVWSVGLTILEIAVGHYPYPAETHDNMFSQLTAIVDGEPPKLDSRFSKEAQMFVKQCLTKKADLRPSYAILLASPWLSKYRDCDPEMGKIVTERIKIIQERTPSRQNSVKKKSENVKSLLKEKVRAPALHRGGLSMQGRFR